MRSSILNKPLQFDTAAQIVYDAQEFIEGIREDLVGYTNWQNANFHIGELGRLLEWLEGQNAVPPGLQAMLDDASGPADGAVSGVPVGDPVREAGISDAVPSVVSGVGEDAGEDETPAAERGD